jgi:hypothetical protein
MARTRAVFAMHLDRITLTPTAKHLRGFEHMEFASASQYPMVPGDRYAWFCHRLDSSARWQRDTVPKATKAISPFPEFGPLPVWVDNLT